MVVKNPTIRDVAVEAGVSVATVSRVLNNRPDASARITALMTMREMVEAAIYGAVHDVGPNIPNDISVIGLPIAVLGPNLTFRASNGPVRRNRTTEIETPQRKDLAIRSYDEGTTVQKGGE
jgi:hypothetical protein